MFMNILMLILAAAASFGGVRQSRIARATGNNAIANVWLVVAVFCGIIAVLQVIGLFTN